MAMRRVTTIFQGLQGAPYFNQLYFDAATGTATEAATAVDTFWGSVDAALDSNLSWTRQADIATIDEVSGDLTGLESVASTSGTGAIAGDVAPTFVQGLIRWRTEVPFAGRLLQGRTFIPGIPEGNLADGRPSSGLQTVLANAANALIADIGTALVVFRRPVTADPDATPPVAARNGAFAHVVVAIVSTDFAVLRTRRD